MRTGTLLAGLAAVFHLSCSPSGQAGGGATDREDGSRQFGLPGNGISPQPVCCMPPEPDYEEVMRREFRAARAEGTREALVRFIARHPEHPLAETARSLLWGEAARKETWRPLEGAGDVFSAFDHARRQHTVAAYDAFIDEFAPHPLVSEAQRLRETLR